MKVLLKMTVLQFKMLLRDKALILGSLGIALISMLIFGALFANDRTQALTVGVADLDKSATSAKLIDVMKQNDGMTVTEGDQTTLLDELKNGKRSAVIVLQPGFESGLASGTSKVQFYVDNSNMITAARARGMVTGVFDEVSKQMAGYKSPIQVAEEQVTARSFRDIDFLTPGMLGMTIMFANMYVGVSLINWRERGTLKRLSATPLKSWQLMGSQIISQFALSFGQAVLVLLTGVLIFNVQVKVEWLGLIALFVVLGTFSIMSLGYAVGNFVKKREAAQNVVTLIALPMMFLAGSYFPVEPEGFLKVVVDILPLTHLNRALREIMLGESSFSALAVNFGVLAAFGVILTAFSIRTFRWSR